MTVRLLFHFSLKALHHILDEYQVDNVSLAMSHFKRKKIKLKYLNVQPDHIFPVQFLSEPNTTAEYSHCTFSGLQEQPEALPAARGE